jgi:hypothetical protein
MGINVARIELVDETVCDAVSHLIGALQQLIRFLRILKLQQACLYVWFSGETLNL